MEFNCPRERNHEKDCCWWPVCFNILRRSHLQSQVTLMESKNPSLFSQLIMIYSYAVLEITVGHRTLSDQILKMYSQFHIMIRQDDSTSPAYLELPSMLSVNKLCPVQFVICPTKTKDLNWHMSCEWRKITSSTAHVHTTTFPPPPL